MIVVVYFENVYIKQCNVYIKRWTAIYRIIVVGKLCITQKLLDPRFLPILSLYYIDISKVSIPLTTL